MSEANDEHDPTGHVWLSASVNWECHICGRDVRVAEWVPLGNGNYGWRWVHITKEEGGHI